MNEDLIELPLMKYPLKVKTLNDMTIICTCKLPDAKKFCLVVDERVDTVLFFHFDTRRDLLKAVLIKADDCDEYLDKLFKLFPNLKAWLSSIPFGEPGDLIHVRLMDDREFFTKDIHWERDDFTYQFHFKIGRDYDEIIKIEDIRYLHVQYTDETFITINEIKELFEETGSKRAERDLKVMELVITMAEEHIKNFNKRQLVKQLKEQNNEKK